MQKKIGKTGKTRAKTTLISRRYVIPHTFFNCPAEIAEIAEILVSH
jgi:hypothetical protein